VDTSGPNPWKRAFTAGSPEFAAPTARPPCIVNADQVEPREDRRKTTGRRIRDLARAAGSVRTGMRLSHALPGMLNCPPHCHSMEEELFVVLSGDGTLLLGDEEFPLRPGHVVGRPPGTGLAHAFRGGPGGLELLMYGDRQPGDVAHYPRSGKVYFRGLRLIGRIEPLDYWEGEE
jgi:uncharacterized cupin superfamily protein